MQATWAFRDRKGRILDSYQLHHTHLQTVPEHIAKRYGEIFHGDSQLSLLFGVVRQGSSIVVRSVNWRGGGFLLQSNVLTHIVRVKLKAQLIAPPSPRRRKDEGASNQGLKLAPSTVEMWAQEGSSNQNMGLK